MDIKEQIEKLVERLTEDGNLKDLFDKEPVKVIEKVIGMDLPDDVVEKIIDGVKAKFTLDQVADVAGMFKKLF